MEDKRKKQIVISIVGVLLLIIITIGVTYTFFNYTRTGSPNTISTGRIYFNSEQSNTLNVTNVFPVKSTNLNTNSLDSVEVTINGDTTYPDGEEFLISLVDVNNTYNGKTIPLNYIATYTASTGKVIGSASNTYWESRESKNANIYLLNATGEVKENAQVLVGYIKSGQTGIGGTITIKAYVDGERLAISDTLENGPIAVTGYTNGTTSEWVDGRTVLTTEEWNNFQGNNSISFKIRAESNEGIWVDEPANGTIDSCPGCKFMYHVSDSADPTTYIWTTWNNQSQTPTVLTSGLYDNYEELIATTNKNYFLGVKLNSSNQVTNAYACGVKDNVPFCIEGTSDGANYTTNQTLLQGANLYNNTCTVHVENEGTSNEYELEECGPWNNSSILSSRLSSNGSVAVGITYNNACACDAGIIACFTSNSSPTN